MRRTISAMKFWARMTVLLPVVALAGCTVSSNSSAGNTPLASWTNWQFQAGSAITSPPNTFPNFVGALQIQGSEASGTLSTTASATSGAQSLSFVGWPSGAATSISTVTNGWQLTFPAPSTVNSTVPVGVTGGCVGPPSSLPECTAIFQVSPTVGVEIAPLNGTFAGTLTESATPSASGTATLTLTQSATPGSNGSFALTASLVLPAQLGTYSGSGTVSGEGLSLRALTSAPGGTPIAFSGSTNPAATQITVSNLTFLQAGITYSFTGTLTRQ